MELLPLKVLDFELQMPTGPSTGVVACILLVSSERFHRGRGLFLLLAVATGFYMLKVPNWESLSPKY